VQLTEAGLAMVVDATHAIRISVGLNTATPNAGDSIYGCLITYTGG
jgi:hypothetical protein